MRLSDRIRALERVVGTTPMMVLHIDGEPTAAQQSVIDRSARTGQRLFVYDNLTSAAWMPGCGVPWELSHGTA